MEWPPARLAGRGLPPGFRLEWNPRSAMPQPVLTVWAVPSADRAAIRAWIGATAMASMRAWLQAAEAAPQTWRDAEHNAAWHWPATEADSGLALLVTGPSPGPDVEMAGIAGAQKEAVCI